MKTNRTALIFQLFLVFLICTTKLSAQQQFAIASFQETPFDLTAQNPEHQKKDGSGSLYAIIKVTSDNANDKLMEYLFDFGMLNHKVEDKGDQLWLYVQRNAKHVTISRKGYTTIRKYDLGLTIQPGHTYALQLSPKGAKVRLQWVKFVVEPTDAHATIMVTVEEAGAVETVAGTTDEKGQLSKSLPFGSYTYRVISENFHPCDGRLTLNNEYETLRENISLRPLFSTVTLLTKSEADIYVNGEKKGTHSWTGRLNSGSYNVECRMDGHEPSMRTVTIEEGKTLTINLEAPTPIMGTLSVNAQPEATITVDGKSYGTTPKNIPLVIGKHSVKLSKSGYEESISQVEIRKEEYTELSETLKPQFIERSYGRSSNSSSTLRNSHETTEHKWYSNEGGFHFGVTGGVNWGLLTVMSGSSDGELFKMQTGWTAGIVADYLWPGENYAFYGIHSGLFFTQKNYLEDVGNTTIAYPLNATSSYLKVPISYMYQSYIFQFDIGFFASFLVSSDSNDWNYGEKWENPFDAGITLGIGLQASRFRLHGGFDLGLVNRFKSDYFEDDGIYNHYGDYSSWNFSITFGYMLK